MELSVAGDPVAVTCCYCVSTNECRRHCWSVWCWAWITLKVRVESEGDGTGFISSLESNTEGTAQNLTDSPNIDGVFSYFMTLTWLNQPLKTDTCTIRPSWFFSLDVMLTANEDLYTLYFCELWQSFPAACIICCTSCLCSVESSHSNYYGATVYRLHVSCFTHRRLVTFWCVADCYDRLKLIHIALRLVLLYLLLISDFLDISKLLCQSKVG